MQIFADSSHFKNWFFNQKQLDDMYQMRIKIYVHFLKVKQPLPQFTIKEENIVINNYIRNISEICRAAELPLNVEGTAISYFKRVYLKKTLFTSKPEQILLNCIYLACKSLEISYELMIHLSEKIKKDTQDSTNIHFNQERYGQSEESLLKQLNFDLVIYQVFRPLESVLKLCEQKLQNSQQYENFKNQCIQLARLSFQDQMIFQFSHSMIALGVLNQSNKKLQIFSNLFQQLSINLTDQQENQLDNIEQELRNMENKNLQDEYTERKAIQKMIHEVQKLHKTKVASPGFQKPMENPILMRLSSQQQKKSEQASEQQIKKIKTDSND